MINTVRNACADAQAMMQQDSRMNPVGTKTAMEDEKKQRTLEEEKKSVQNSLLLMKSTSGDSVGSEESIRLLEKKLEEIQSQIKAGENEQAVSAEEGLAVQENKGVMIRNNFDVYVKGE